MRLLYCLEIDLVDRVDISWRITGHCALGAYQKADTTLCRTLDRPKNVSTVLLDIATNGELIRGNLHGYLLTQILFSFIPTAIDYILNLLS
jgi:hypothetical protein